MQIAIDQQHFSTKAVPTGTVRQASGDIQGDGGASAPGLCRKESEDILLDRWPHLVNCAIHAILKLLQRDRGNQKLRDTCSRALRFLSGLPACAESDDGGLWSKLPNIFGRCHSAFPIAQIEE